MAGISTRTLRYYDEVGLLKPAKINSSGYRIYGKEEVDRLHRCKQLIHLTDIHHNIDNSVPM